MIDPFMLDYFLEDELNLPNIVHAAIDQNEQNVVRQRRVSIPNEEYVEHIVPNYTLSEFKDHFRMTREDAEALYRLLAPHFRERHVIVSLEKKVLFFLWLLAKQESFLACSDRFGFATGTGHYVFTKVLSAMTVLKEQFIQWPNAQERIDIARRIENRYQLPGIVGVIDGCHICIKQPTHNAIDFCNRKGQHSIILQAICDDRKILTDVFIGMPGRAHDARVLRNSPIYGLMTGNPPLLSAEQHTVGDAAYPLLPSLLKPYRDNGHLNPRQTRFNQVLSAQRSVIERAFALLKGKWRRLKYLDMSLADKVPEVVLAACILHNFLLKRTPGEEEEGNEQDVDDGAEHSNPGDDIDVELNNIGAAKRDYIATLL